MDENVKETEMSFGLALSQLEQGKKVCRSGWNGKGMWLILIRGSHFEKTSGDYAVNHTIWRGECLPFIAMKTANDKLVPWLASQTDMLSADWEIVK